MWSVIFGSVWHSIPFFLSAGAGAILFGLILQLYNSSTKQTVGESKFPRNAVFLFFACILGLTVGILTGFSRESAIGSVLPAVLTLIGGVVGFFFSTSNDKKPAVLLAAIALVIFIFWGTLAGARLRSPWEKYQRDLELTRHQLEMQKLQYQNDLEMLKLKYRALLEKEAIKYKTELEAYKKENPKK